MTPHSENIPYGYCHCNCGQKTTLAKQNHTKFGYVKGEPVPYVSGHNRRHPRIDFTDAAPFKIEGVYCKVLPLNRGLLAIVWASDYARLSRFTWSAIRPNRTTFYAVRHAEGGSMVLLHHEVAGIFDGTILDHENRNGLDNRQHNLRDASKGQNNVNSKINKRNTSGFRGVSKSTKNRWRARISDDIIGYFSSKIDAAKARDIEAVRRYGKFAVLNFPDGEHQSQILVAGPE